MGAPSVSKGKPGAPFQQACAGEAASVAGPNTECLHGQRTCSAYLSMIFELIRCEAELLNCMCYNNFVDSIGVSFLPAACGCTLECICRCVWRSEASAGICERLSACRWQNCCLL